MVGTAVRKNKVGLGLRPEPDRAHCPPNAVEWFGTRRNVPQLFLMCLRVTHSLELNL